jgi:hypothetical protein
MSIIPLSSVVLTRAEESGEVAGRYGLVRRARCCPLAAWRVPRPWPGCRAGGVATALSLARPLIPASRSATPPCSPLAARAARSRAG